MYKQLKERIKKHEGFVPKIYKDSLGKKTIGYRGRYLWRRQRIF